MTTLADTREAVIEFDRLERTFQNGAVGLQPTTLTICAGERIAVLGPSGSGKSTLLGILGLLDPATCGEYRLKGEPVARLSDRQRTRFRAQFLGFVFQSFYLIPHLTALENVHRALLVSERSSSATLARARAAIESVGLGRREHALPSTMSGGEQQRVAVARAVVRQPALLLCDEPTGNLDSRSSDLVLNAILGSHSERRTTIVVTHNPDVALLCDRTLLIRDGIATFANG